MVLFTGVHLCTFNIVAPIFITFCQMFGSCLTPSARPSLLMFHINRPIARITSTLELYLAVVLSLWRRYYTPMDSCRVSTVNVQESPIVSGTRGLLQQRCDSLHCLEKWWGSVPPSVVVFSQVLRRWQWEILEHPPYSPDMSPWDYNLFVKVKEPLRGTRYVTRDELIRAIGR